MGADRWETCPRCLDRANAEYAEVLVEHGKKYGVVTIEEWAELSANLVPPPDPESNELCTFREDFEWWTEDGCVRGVFKGHCTKCGLDVEYKVTPVPFYEPRES